MSRHPLRWLFLIAGFFCGLALSAEVPRPASAPVGLAPRSEEADIAYRAGRDALKAGDRESGVAQLERAVAIDPAFEAALTLLARAYADSGRDVESQTMFHRAAVALLARMQQGGAIPQSVAGEAPPVIEWAGNADADQIAAWLAERAGDATGARRTRPVVRRWRRHPHPHQLAGRVFTSETRRGEVWLGNDRRRAPRGVPCREIKEPPAGFLISEGFVDPPPDPVADAAAPARP